MIIKIIIKIITTNKLTESICLKLRCFTAPRSHSERFPRLSLLASTFSISNASKGLAIPMILRNHMIPKASRRLFKTLFCVLVSQPYSDAGSTNDKRFKSVRLQRYQQLRMFIFSEFIAPWVKSTLCVTIVMHLSTKSYETSDDQLPRHMYEQPEWYHSVSHSPRCWSRRPSVPVDSPSYKTRLEPSTRLPGNLQIFQYHQQRQGR